MKKITSLLLLTAFLLTCHGVSAARPTGKNLEAGFRQLPDSILTSVYWYWISDHISEEGIVKDLRAMKSAGINRAFIGNIGMDDGPLGPGAVPCRSEAWWKAMHTAMKTAGELGIEIGVFNSPGWSQSGGPWVQAGQAMRYLASMSVQVSGGGPVKVALPRPEGAYKEQFQNVKVLAYPAHPQGAVRGLTASVTPAAEGPDSIFDSSLATACRFALPSERGDVMLDITAPRAFTLRSLKLYATTAAIDCAAELLVKRGGQYDTIAKFPVARYNSASNVGFDPYPPVVVSVVPTLGAEFRLILRGAQAGAGIRELELSEQPCVERYPEKTMAKMFQSPLPYWHEYMWREQPEAGDASLAVDPSSVLELSGCLQGDTLVWNAPAGNWTVLRMGMVPTGTFNAPARADATGLEVDKMSREHTRAHFDAYMGEMLRRIPAEDRTTWKVVVQDSYETGGQNFTDDFIETFRMRYGYDPVPFFPVYYGTVVGSQDLSDRFLWDMRRFVADRVAYDYVGGLRDVSHEHGLHTWLECYGHWGFPGEFLQYGGQSDEIGGEYWATGTLGDIENRAASSCGHIYGKTRISAESFTAGDGVFERAPADLKARADRFFAEGINSSLLHLYIHQPYDDKDPGINAWFGTEFNRKNTWFPHMDLFVAYLKRVNYMLQQGLNVADAAYFIGEDAPKMTGVTDPALPGGYQYDYINAEVLLRDAAVRDGRIVLPHGTSYRILVLPKQETMRPEVLTKIAALVRDGAVVLGPAPRRSPSMENYPEADRIVGALADSLWSRIDPAKGHARIGKGWLMDGLDMETALGLIGCGPDFRTSMQSPVAFGHRATPDAEIYFVANQSDSTIEVTPEFRVKGRQPELWSPTDGTSRPLPSFEPTADGVLVPLRFAPRESVFVVFRKDAKPSGALNIDRNFPAPVSVEEIAGPWVVRFDTLRKGPAQPVVMGRLRDLTTFQDSTVRNYSGTVGYKAAFRVDRKACDSRYVIDLGAMQAMAKVRVNGQYVGGVWTLPHKVDVTEALTEGRNELEVEVTTTWKNRLIGDLSLPEAERGTWLMHNPWQADSELQPSGLMGPVVLERVPGKVK